MDNLLDRVSALAALGVGVLYVTHHLGEVFRVANKVSVFRDGKVVGAGPVGDFDHAAIVQLLAGEELLAEETESRQQKAARAAARGHETVFEVETSAPARWPGSRSRPSAARSSGSPDWPGRAATPCSARASARCRATPAR